jgi:hypothetical protein
MPVFSSAEVCRSSFALTREWNVMRKKKKKKIHRNHKQQENTQKSLVVFGCFISGLNMASAKD